MKAAYVILLVGVVSLSFGCYSEDRSPESEKWTNTSKQRDWHKDLSEEVGMDFPEGIELLTHSDGGGRHDGYYEWLVLSTSVFVMSEMDQPGVERYVEMPLDNSTAVIESRLERQKLEGVEESYGCGSFGTTPNPSKNS